MLKQIPTLDSFSWQPPIISILDEPPMATKGDRYIVGEGTGDWSGQDNNIAWYDTAWNFTLATDGMTVFDMSANSYLTFDITSDSWVNNSDLYLKLDQTTPQTIANGLPTFSSGVISPYVYGSNTSGGDILLSSTSDATKGAFNIQVRDGDSVLGSELITNGSFTGSATGWTLGTGWAYGTNNVIHTPGTASALEPSTPVSLENGKAYLFTITISGITAGTVSIRRGTTILVSYTAAGTFHLNRTMSGSDNFNLYASADFDGVIDNVSVKEVASNPSFSAYTTAPDSNGSIDFRISEKNQSIGTNAGRYMYGNANTNLGYFSGAYLYGNANTNLGYFSGAYLDGYSNTNLGDSSGAYLSGDYNTNLGGFSGYSLSGDSNTNLGRYSGYNLDGSYNTNLGRYSGYNLDGSYNTNLGRLSGYGLDGFYNTNLGDYSGYYLSGSSNTNLGRYSGYYLNGSYNVFIGNNARFLTSMTVNNKLFIDVEQTDTPLIYGEFDNDLIRINGDLEVTDDLSVTDRVLVGTDASLTDFPDAKAIISFGDTGYNSGSNIGLVVEGARVGVVGVGYVGGTSGEDSHGTEGIAKVATGVTGQARGGYFISTDVHTGGPNLGIYSMATDGTYNEAYYGYAETNGSGNGFGIYAECEVGASADTGTAYGGFFLSNDTHTGGPNYGAYFGAANGSVNYGILTRGDTTGAGNGYGIKAEGNTVLSADTGTAYAGHFEATETHAGGENYGIYTKATSGTVNYGLWSHGTDYSFYGDEGKIYNEDEVLLGTTANNTDFSSAQLVSSNYDTGFTFSSPTGVVGEGGRVGVYGVGTARGASAGWGVIGRAKTENSANTGNSYGVYAVAEDTHEGGSNQGLVARASGGATNYAIFADGSDYSFYGDEGKIYNEDQLLIGATASLTDFANTKGIISLSNTGKSNADRNALVLETTVTGSTSANGIYVAAGVEKSTDTGVARAGQFLSNSTHNGNNYAIYADANNGVSNFSFYGIHGQFYNAEGIRTQISNANVSNPPTDAQLDSAFGDPTTKGSGWMGVVDDAGAGTNVYFVYTTGNAGEWFWVQGTKAT